MKKQNYPMKTPHEEDKEKSTIQGAPKAVSDEIGKESEADSVKGARDSSPEAGVSGLPKRAMSGGDMADSGMVCDNEAGKALTVEERLAKLEAIFANHEGNAHSARSYEAARKARTEASRDEAMKVAMEKLRLQTMEAQKLYPRLDLAKEAKDPRFTELLKCGLDVRSAFEVVHKDEIISASMEYAAREVERMLTNKVLAEGGRPTENGGIHGPALSKTDPKSMTRQERKDIIRRVFAGEKITF